MLQNFLKRTSIVTAGLGLSTYFYYSLQKKRLATESVYLDERQAAEVLQTSKFHHDIPLNLWPKKERVIIIGGGIVGITTAFYLLETKRFDVVLLEKNRNVSQETSFKNGCLFCPCLCDPWINQHMYKYLYKALFYKDFNISIYFGFLKDYFSSMWILNMLPNTIPYKVKRNSDKLHKMAKVSEEELNRIFSTGILDRNSVESHIQGNLTLYEKKEEIGLGAYEFKIKKGYKGEILENQAIYDKEKSLKSSNVEKYKAGVLLHGDTNLNIYKFDLDMVSYLKNKYPENFTVLTTTSHEKFLVNKSDQKIIGIQTNRGNLFGDKFIVAAGNYSKTVLKTLGIRIPIIPVKGHALSVPVSPNNPKLIYNVTNDITKIYLTQIDKTYRLSGAADFQGMDFQINEKRIDQLKVFLRDIIGGEIDLEKGEGWCCLRPVSSDDVPIVSKITGHENLYINGGHGSKGLTLALGSGVLMRDILQDAKGKLNEKDYELDRFFFV